MWILPTLLAPVLASLTTPCPPSIPQADPRLEVHSTAPGIAGRAGELRDTVLGARPGGGGFEAARCALGLLRLGECERAAEVVAGACRALRDGEAAAPCWTAAAAYWYARATGDTAPFREHLDALGRAIGGDGVPPTFVEGAMRAHAMFCLGGLCEATGGDGAPWRQRAIAHWLELERQTWQPGRGHFRPRPTCGEIALPEPADVSIAAPAAAGMLIASGDRALRNLRTFLAAPVVEATPPWAEHFARDTIAAAAAVQLGDEQALASLWPALLTHPAATTHDAAGRLDAILFAMTGLRVATGEGVDEGWLRLRPWLPPGSDRIDVTGLRAEGAVLDVFVVRHPGETTPRVRVLLRTTHDGATRPLIVHASGASYVTRLSPGESFETPRQRAKRN
jgi:hypothetical protein